MKKLGISSAFVLFTLVVVAAAAGSDARTQDSVARPEPASTAPQSPQIDPAYEVLKRREGTWDSSMELQISADRAPMVAKGVQVDRLSADGLWLISDFKSDFMGRPFHGHAITGYDPVKRKYVGVWVDSQRRHLNLVEGDYDAKTKIFTTVSQDRDEKGRTITMKQITDESDPDTRVVTFASPNIGGRSIHRMVITYRRRK